ncbi:MAG: radical SAM protein [Chloroflexaceae bacterium]|nr:radical SAM protein [Chloroflexaceae bacterium]
MIRTIAIPGSGPTWFNWHEHRFLISEDFRSTYSFDHEGRLFSCFLNGANYKRGLDSAILMKVRQRHGEHPKTRTRLTEEQARELLDTVRANMQRIYDYLQRPEHRHQYADTDLLPRLETILAWDSDRLLAERETFRSIYQPVGILPPDQYLSVVLQATEGCSWNRCTFCTLYRNRVFRIKPPQEFRDHARSVRAFLRSGIGLRKSIFLGDANALIIPQCRLLELLSIVHEEFPLETPCPDDHYVLHGIYAFLDIFGAEKKTADDYRLLRDGHIRRIYIGLETGDAHLFRLLNKPGSPDEGVEVVRTIKAAGIAVGIILLVGVGGAPFARQHVRASLETVARMPLDEGDMVYLSPLIVSGDEAYSHQVGEAGIRPLSEAEVTEQLQALKSGIRAATGDKPRVTLYHIQEFLY